MDFGSSWALHCSHWQYPRPSGGEIDGCLVPPLMAEITWLANSSRTAELDVQSQSPSLRWPSAPMAKYSGCSAKVPFGMYRPHECEWPKFSPPAPFHSFQYPPRHVGPLGFRSNRPGFSVIVVAVTARSRDRGYTSPSGP